MRFTSIHVLLATSNAIGYYLPYGKGGAALPPGGALFLRKIALSPRLPRRAA